MKTHLSKGSLILILIILYAVACKKTVESASSQNAAGTSLHDTTLQAVPVVPYPANPVQECNYSPDYGDSILFPQPNSNADFYVYPQNNQGLKGRYLSWPGGLDLNGTTGAIDLTQSQTGQRYAVAFVKDGTSDTCMSQLIIAGASYMDSVYDLSLSDTTSTPYFNANPYATPPCQGSQGPGCKFDYNHYAMMQGIQVDQKTGFINLQKTMKNNPFGLFPENGSTILTTIYYQLADKSNNAPQSIQLRLVYYNKKSDVPPSLLATISDNISNTLGNVLLSTGPPPRPPLIVIVRSH
jgi:hypothetical protein